MPRLAGAVALEAGAEEASVIFTSSFRCLA
jgi:hypothetical protein